MGGDRLKQGIINGAWTLMLFMMIYYGLILISNY
jgi:preprotein translocase subunit SecD